MTAAAATHWAGLGRRVKLALAARDEHAIRIHLAGLSADERGAILERCDKYAARRRS